MLCSLPAVQELELVNLGNALSLSEAAKHLRVGDRTISPQSVWRYARKGVKGVRLQYRRYGRRIVTSVPALEEFSRQLTMLDGEAASPVGLAAEHVAADARCAADGF